MKDEDSSSESSQMEPNSDNDEQDECEEEQDIEKLYQSEMNDGDNKPEHEMND